MIGVLVVTDNIKEWEDKFQSCMKFTSKRRDIYSDVIFTAMNSILQMKCFQYTL